MLLCPSLICVSQKKTTIFRLVKVTGQKLLESLICTSLKIVTFVWERQVKVRWSSRTRTLVLPMICTLSTLFYHLQKRQQAHRPRRRGLVGPLLWIIGHDCDQIRSVSVQCLTMNGRLRTVSFYRKRASCLAKLYSFDSVSNLILQFYIR